MVNDKGVDSYEEVKAKQKLRSRNYYHRNRERCLALAKKWRENKKKEKENWKRKYRTNITEDEYREIKQKRELSHYYKHRDRIRDNANKNYKSYSSYPKKGYSNRKPIPYWLPSITKQKVSVTISFD